MVNYTLFINIIIYDLMDNNIGKLHFICAISVSVNSYTDTVNSVIIKLHANLNVYIAY